MRPGDSLHSIANRYYLTVNTLKDINQLKTKCERNDAEAVPFWFHTNQKMQLLLPLRITDPEKADAALVADKDDASKSYRVRTILTLDVAYSNARLLRKPTQKWLNP